MKKIWTIFMFLICAGIASAKIVEPNFLPTKDEKEFDVVYYQLKRFTPYAVPEEYQQEISVNQAFKVKFNGNDGEIRYSLFKETGENTELQIGSFFYIIFMNLAGETGEIGRGSNFNNSDVEKDFNGTSGYCCTIKNPSSLFGTGYKFINVEIFYKKGQGICLRTMLYNNPEFIVKKYGSFDVNEDFLRSYRCFKFMEKDDTGKYIKPAVK